VDFLFFILPGSRGKADFNLYRIIQRFLVESAPVASQIILNETLNKSDIASFVSKLLIKVCAKT